MKLSIASTHVLLVAVILQLLPHLPEHHGAAAAWRSGALKRLWNPSSVGSYWRCAMVAELWDTSNEV